MPVLGHRTNEEARYHFVWLSNFTITGMEINTYNMLMSKNLLLPHNQMYSSGVHIGTGFIT